MQWFSQNWIWIVFAIGIFLLIRRGGMGCGMGHGHPHHQRESNDRPTNPDSSPKDPVNGAIVNPESAVNAMYQERVYYFSSRKNRDTFDAKPAQYAARAGERDEGHRHHRHCC